MFRTGLGNMRKTSKLRRSDKATGRIRQKPTRLRLGCLLPDEEVKSAMSDGATLIRPTTSSCILHPVSCIKKKAPLLTPSPSYPSLSFFLYPLSFIFYLLSVSLLASAFNASTRLQAIVSAHHPAYPQMPAYGHFGLHARWF